MNNLTDIVKTRHPEAGKPVGILKPEKGKQYFELNRYLPSNKLSNLVEHYWIVRWDLRNKEPYLSETLPHPSVHFVFEKNKTKIYGVQEKKFSVLLKGRGKAIGIKFTPGGFYPFYKKPVSLIKNKTVFPDEIFNSKAKEIEKHLLSQNTDDLIVHETEVYIFNLFNRIDPGISLPYTDESLSFIREVTSFMKNETKIINVEQAANKFKISVRNLQRLFYQYVGVTPKWVIKRFRLHNAAELISSSHKVDLAALAVQAGYYDQAHFIKDFRSIIGKSPSAYLKDL